MIRGIAVSNIAWAAEEERAIARLLADHAVRAIEVAPGRLFANPSSVHPDDVAAVRAFWADFGIDIVAMQSLLFGGPHVSLFGTSEERRAMADYLQHLVDLAGRLGCGPLVFGSPRNRTRGTLPEEEAFRRAAEFFLPLAQRAADKGCVIAFEPNARDYGCDFVTHISEAVHLARMVNHPGFRVQLDCAVAAMEGDSPEMIRDAAPWIVHVHASAPFLGQLTEGLPIAPLLDAVTQGGYQGHVSIEMRKPGDGSAVTSVSQALVWLKRELRTVG
jgi:sugar phosphate isomerase/epimerase